MIPKIIHQIWIGPNELPKQEQQWCKTWRDAHPDWEYKLWTNDDLPKDITPQCQATIESVYPKYACIADVYRYIILSRYGGVYIDTDIECYKPIDELCDVDFLGIIPHERCNYITNAFFGCIASSEVLMQCVECIKPVAPEHFKHAYACIGPSFLTAQFCKVNKFALNKNNLEDASFNTSRIINCTNWYDKSRNGNSYMTHHWRASHIHVTK